MTWTVLYHDAFLPELEVLAEEVQDGLLTMAELLQAWGRRWVGRMPTRWRARNTPT